VQNNYFDRKISSRQINGNLSPNFRNSVVFYVFETCFHHLFIRHLMKEAIIDITFAQSNLVGGGGLGSSIIVVNNAHDIY
jgi:hypothetical protein